MQVVLVAIISCPGRPSNKKRCGEEQRTGRGNLVPFFWKMNHRWKYPGNTGSGLFSWWQTMKKYRVIQITPDRSGKRLTARTLGRHRGTKTGHLSHFRLILRLCRSVNFQPLCTKAEHWIPLLLPVLSSRLRCRCFCKETLHRVPATCTGPVFKLPAVIAGRHLGGQERREVVLPEGSVNPSGF